MSTGAAFRLIADDGVADRLIMANSLLNQRIRQIMAARRQAGYDDLTPSLKDIEQTHILFMNAHFKPFAPVANEYQRNKVQSGNAAFGSSATYSLAQFGDFIYDIGLYIRISEAKTIAGTTPTQSGDIAADAASNYPADVIVDGEPDQLVDAYSLVDAFGNALPDQRVTQIIPQLKKFLAGLSLRTGNRQTPLKMDDSVQIK